MTIECQNCDWTGQPSEAAWIKDLNQRVAAGETMPAGECPACGALCHERDERRPTYGELLSLVTQIASFIKDGDELEGVEHDMTNDDALDTANACISMCRDLLKTNGDDLPPISPPATA